MGSAALTAYQRIYRRLRDAIVGGSFAFGSRLPSKRAIAVSEGVGVITVEHAYALLCDEGYAEARERSGYFAAYRKGDGDSAGQTLPLPNVSRRVSPKPNLHRLPTDFPFSTVTRKMRGVLVRYGERILIKSPNAGTAELREAIAAYLNRAKGMRVKPSQVVIGSGAEYLYGLLAQTFAGQRFAVEDPSYEKISTVYAAHGIAFDRLRLGSHGILSAELDRTEAQILHVTPYRSFPSGVTADASKRHEYVRWAARRGGFLIEDDFDSEFAVAGRGEETLFSTDEEGRVVYVNTFSKTIAPSIRVGYMVLPPRLLAQFQKTVGFYSCTVPVFEQYFLADFINDGDFERHLCRVRRRQSADGSVKISLNFETSNFGVRS